VKIDRDNPNAERVRDLKFDSVQKHCLSLAPPKERQVMEGDAKDAPAPHYLTFVNNFSKWHRQVQIGQARLPPPKILRQELEPTLATDDRALRPQLGAFVLTSDGPVRQRPLATSLALYRRDFERSSKLWASFTVLPLSPKKSREPERATALRGAAPGSSRRMRKLSAFYHRE
jgi:hypothetical protein